MWSYCHSCHQDLYGYLHHRYFKPWILLVCSACHELGNYEERKFLSHSFGDWEAEHKVAVVSMCGQGILLGSIKKKKGCSCIIIIKISFSVLILKECWKYHIWYIALDILYYTYLKSVEVCGLFCDLTEIVGPLSYHSIGHYSSQQNELYIIKSRS